MSATAGMRCSECGFAAGSEKHFHRRRVRLPWIAAGGLIVISSYPVLQWPQYQRLQSLGVGWLAFVPRTAVAAFWPLLLDHDNPAQPRQIRPQARPVRIGFHELATIIDPATLSAVQRWVLIRSCGHVFQQSDDIAAIQVAYRLSFDAVVTPECLTDVYMSRFVDPVRGRPLWASGTFSAIEGTVDLRWAARILPLVEDPNTASSVDMCAFTLLARSGLPLDSLVQLFDQPHFARGTKSQLASALVEANISEESRKAVLAQVTSLRLAPQLIPLYVARLQTVPACFNHDLANLITSDSEMLSILGCAAVARAGIWDPTTEASLYAASRSNAAPIRRSANLALALLRDDREALDRECSEMIGILRLGKDQQGTTWAARVLLEFAKHDLLPQLAELEGLVAILEGSPAGNPDFVGEAASLLIACSADDHQAIRESLIRKFLTKGTGTEQTLHAINKRGTGPRALLDAARTSVMSYPEPWRTRYLAMLDRVQAID